MCHPSFGYAHDKKARRCARHRLQGMEGVKGRRKNNKRQHPSTTAAGEATGADLAGGGSFSANHPRSAPCRDARGIVGAGGGTAFAVVA